MAIAEMTDRTAEAKAILEPLVEQAARAIYEADTEGGYNADDERTYWRAPNGYWTTDVWTPWLDKARAAFAPVIAAVATLMEARNIPGTSPESAELRRLADNPERPNVYGDWEWRDEVCPALRKAADRIDALTADTARLRFEVQNTKLHYHEIKQRAEQAEADLTVLRERVEKMADVLQWLDRLGGLGSDKHARIKAALSPPAAPRREGET